MSGPSLYRRVLGDAFERLPAPVKALHGGPGTIVAIGRCTVQRGRSLPARLLAVLFGFPPPGDDVPCRVVIEADGAGERWLRDFGGHRLVSLQGPATGHPGLLFERFGATCFTIDPRPTERGLSLVIRGGRLLGIPLPRFLWPMAVGEATAAEECYHFDVSIAVPLAGLLLRYRGWLRPEEAGEPGSDRQATEIAGDAIKAEARSD